jgi:hypothetical protein
MGLLAANPASRCGYSVARIGRWCNLGLDVNYHWTRDREQVPDPITPMYSSVAGLLASEGRARMFLVYEETIVEPHDRCVSTYDYTRALSPPKGRLVPFTRTPGELRARARRNREEVSAVSRRARVGHRPGASCATRLSTTSTSRIRLNPADPCQKAE